MGSRLDGKVVMLTGAAGGLGRATALAMAREGARLALTDIDEAQLDESVRLVRDAGGQAVIVAGDVVDAATHRTTVALAVSTFGRLDGLCNIAGMLGPGTLADATGERFDRIMHVNCFSQVLSIQHAAPAMRASGGGAIVNVASIGALVALPMMSLYCASKAAVLGLTRALAVELAPGHIRCNAICPGGIDSPMSRGLIAQIPEDHREEFLAKLTGRQIMKRFATPEEIAGSLVFLVSDESSFLTGSVIAADGGHSAS